jgi:hypothetical protein
MGKQNITAGFSDILDIITSEIAGNLQSNVMSYSSININIQDGKNSTDCTNFIFDRDKTLYYISSDFYESEYNTQTVVLTILQKLTDTQSATATGGLLGSQDEAFYASIKDMLNTSLTSVNLVKIGQNTSNVSINVQKCNGSIGDKNVIISSSRNIYKYYYNLYAQDETIQSLAADISNYISGSQDEKKTGFLVVLLRMIAIVVLGIAVACLAAVGLYIMVIKG